MLVKPLLISTGICMNTQLLFHWHLVKEDPDELYFALLGLTLCIFFTDVTQTLVNGLENGT